MHFNSSIVNQGDMLGHDTRPAYRILFVSPGMRLKYRSYFYSHDKKMRNGFIRNNSHVIHFHDRDCADMFLGMRALGTPYANRQFAEIAATTKPDLIAIYQADLIKNDTLKLIRAQNPTIKMINIYNDMIYSPERFKRVLDRGLICDHTFLNSAGPELTDLRKAGIEVSYFPNLADASVENINGYEREQKDFDLVFVSGEKRSGGRFTLVDELARIAPSLKIGVFSGDNGPVFNADFYELLLRGACGLNWSAKNDLKYCTSDRLVQIFGLGIAACIPRSIGFQDFIPEDCAIFFDDAEDLAKSLFRLKAEDGFRDIARRGKAACHTLFNETRVMGYMLDRTFGRPSDVEWAGL